MSYQCFQGIIICILVVIVDVSSVDQQDALSPNNNNTVAAISVGNVLEKSVSSNETKIANEVLNSGSSNEMSKNISLVESQALDPYRNKTVVYSPKSLLYIRSGALQRTGLVTLGVMSAVVLFFVIRAVRIRHRRSKSRKYGVISSTASEMEMEPLEGRDDEDEEETLFDSQQKYLIK